MALLRRRLQAVINERGTCVTCGYLLLGVPVSDDLKVTCPECGGVTEVDASIAELQQGASGAEFRPTVRVTRPVRTPQQCRRRRRLMLAVIGVAVLVLLTPLAMVGWNEVAMRIDAKRAAATRPGALGLAAVIATLPPSTGEVVGWDEFQKVRAVIAKADAAVWQGEGALRDSRGDVVRPDYSWVGEVISEDFRGDRETAEASRVIAERMLTEMKKLGAFEQMKEMRRAGVLTPPFLFASGQPLIGVLLPELAQCREMARINKARALKALAADDPDEFCDAVQNVHFIARLCEREPLVISRLVAVAIDALGDGVCKRALMTRHSAAWADAVARGQVRRTPEVPYSYTLQGERVVTIDSACFFYEDPTNVRRRQLELYSERMEKGSNIRVGRLHEALAEINAAYDAGVAAAAQEVSQRTDNPVVERSELWIVRTLLPALLKAQRSFDQIEADRKGVEVMVALERYRAAHGGYPERLDELAPRFLSAVPIDAWADLPYCYRRIDAAADPVGRGYLLYLRGRDKVDDGGKAGEFYLDALTNPKLRGIDYIINDETHVK
ncbi:MAG: hypothetical protein QM783_15560 [Phycisphaerales bacterium]